MNTIDNMKPHIILVTAVFATLFSLGLPVLVQAQDNKIAPTEATYFIGQVNGVEHLQKVDNGESITTTKVHVTLLSGPKNGEAITIDLNEQVGANPTQTTADAATPKIGTKVIITELTDGTETHYELGEPYRLPALFGFLIVFALLIIWIARLQGLTSLIGLGFSLLVLTNYVVPQIFQGHNPLLVSLAGAVFIAGVSLYLAHGFHKRTTVALASTLITILVAAFLATLAVRLIQLFGLGSEEALYLQLLNTQTINLQGLLLGGMIIGTLGVLDDITAAQSTTIDELIKANPKASAAELYRSGFAVGKEHITSLVNTLVLTYVGASFPLFLLLTQGTQPLWVTANSEIISQEIVRTLVGGSALLLAVPITTYLSVRYLKTKNVDSSIATDN